MTHSEDLITLKEWFCDEMIEGIQKDEPDRRTWEKTGHITLLRISLFNKRREFKVSDFMQIHQHDDVDR
ncbi:hypothetical protein DPMN_143314 [Dreissena polymorpha]|uniref:Uncharacterized protein n=1 Tax=Dreissena polymorpha TaxID=45954 RepID=A0A9D4GCP3_DREPO|nr:hypothetical protein DPMN_143314 [Dreissena polymorpha]